MAAAQRLGPGLVAALDRVGQSIGRALVHGGARRRAGHAGPAQRPVARATEGGARGHHAHLAAARGGQGGADGGFDAHDGQVRVAGAQRVDANGRGRVAGQHQQVQGFAFAPVAYEGKEAFLQSLRGSLAIRRPGVVGQVAQVGVRQGFAQGPPHAQAPDAAVEDTDDGARVAQAVAREMPLNSPEAMRWLHSAGPVMCALVPPASTATVTGMSTTSNS